MFGKPPIYQQSLKENLLIKETQSFTEDLIVKSLGEKWELMESFRFYYEHKQKIKFDIVVPKGFITDFASTPTFLYSIFPPVGIYNKAAIMHDYLYDKYCAYQNISRRKADLFFLQAMKVLKVPLVKRLLMYIAVRIGGYNRFRKKSYIHNFNNNE